MCESHDSTGEPGAGNRPAGFGERGEETCPRESACGPVAKAPDEPPIPPTGDAPPLDSTLETLATRITVESDAAFEVFDHAYRDECRSLIAGDPDWGLAAEWFGEPFLPAVYGILDTERELVVRAVRDDAAAGRPVRAAMLWRSALASMAARLREFVHLLVLAYSSAPDSPPATAG